MLYNFLWFNLYFILKIVSIFNKGLRDFINKRVKIDYRLPEAEYIWIHASSVGEINLSTSLIDRYINEKEFNILITMMTDTGYARAKELYKDNSRVFVKYFPLDNLFSIKKILQMIKLESLIIVETEIWPNLISLSTGNLFMINGRISDKSFGKYKKISVFLKPYLKKINCFLMQSLEDAKRIISIGADLDKVKSVGNLKFDIDLPDYNSIELGNLKKELKINDEKIFVIGSSRDGEEEILLNYLMGLDYKIIIVPRHLERVEEIISVIGVKDLTYSLFSKGVSNDSKVIIVDRMGALRKFYAIADITFVGGTLVNVGGHSLLEPLYYGKTPIFGKYLQNVKDISAEILKRGIGYKINNKDEFLNAIGDIEKKSDKYHEIDRFFKENSKVLDKIWQIVVK